MRADVDEPIVFGDELYRRAREEARRTAPSSSEAAAAAATLPPTRVGDAPRAPAGTFLHRLAGDPARLAATWLGLPHAHDDDATREALLGYRDELVTHGHASSEALVAALPGAVCLAEQVPIVPLGSCFRMDLALSHRGQGNSTDQVRPIANMQYTRRWFTDNKNFHRQRPLEIPRAEYARIPDEHRSLFDRARQPGPRVDR